MPSATTSTTRWRPTRRWACRRDGNGRAQANVQRVVGADHAAPTQGESLAALVARLKLDAAAERGDAEVAAQLDPVVDLIGATELCSSLDERERATVIGHATTMFRQAMELIEDPLWPGGWFYTDPQIIQGQGAGSTVVAQLLLGAGIRQAGRSHPRHRYRCRGPRRRLLPGFPRLDVLGIDPWELSLELARQNVAASGFGSRITLQQARIEAFEDDGRFDLGRSSPPGRRRSV